MYNISRSQPLVSLSSPLSFSHISLHCILGISHYHQTFALLPYRPAPSCIVPCFHTIVSDFQWAFGSFIILIHALLCIHSFLWYLDISLCRLTVHIFYARVLIIYIMYSFDSNKCLSLQLVMIRMLEPHTYLSYPWVPVVTTCGFLTSWVTTRWVLVRTSDFLEVPLPAGKNLCLSLSIQTRILMLT